MNIPSITTTALLGCLVLLGACGRDDDQAVQARNDSEPPRSALGGVVGKAMDKVRGQLETHNLTISDDNSATKAEITPQGELLVGGDEVPINQQQRTLLLKYRGEVIALATAGADIGVDGADFGMRTAGKALGGVLSGNGDQVDKEIEAEARKFEARARKICDYLPPMLETQQQLAAGLPAFRPYATMDQSDIDDCRSDD